MANYAAVCVAPDGDATSGRVTVPLAGVGAHAVGGSDCTTSSTLAPMMVIQAFDGSDGSTGGIGVIPCGGTGQPSCLNGAASGTTACGLPGMPSCTATTSSTSPSGGSQSMDFTIDGFDVVVAVAMVLCFAGGWIAGGQR